MDTSGFYRLVDGSLAWAINAVWAPDYTLLREEQETYTYPTQGGWVWFNTLSEAETYFKASLPKPVEIKVTT